MLLIVLVLVLLSVLRLRDSRVDGAMPMGGEDDNDDEDDDDDELMLLADAR